MKRRWHYRGIYFSVRRCVTSLQHDTLTSSAIVISNVPEKDDSASFVCTPYYRGLLWVMTIMSALCAQESAVSLFGSTNGFRMYIHFLGHCCKHCRALRRLAEERLFGTRTILFQSVAANFGARQLCQRANVYILKSKGQRSGICFVTSCNV